MAEQNIQQALLDCVTDKDKLGSGGEATVYSLKSVPGLEPYALRIVGQPTSYARQLLEDMQSTTSLTPLPQLACGANIGQQLLRTADRKVSIVMFQPGATLMSYMFNDTNRTKANWTFYEKIVAASKRTGINPFLTVGGELQGLLDAGFDNPYLLTTQNVLWDDKGGKFGLVDQITDSTGGYKMHENIVPHLERLWGQLDVEGTRAHLQRKPDPQGQTAIDALTELYNAAHKQAQEGKIQGKVIFTKSHKNGLGNTLKLGDTPAELKTQLDKLRGQALGA